MPAFPLPTRCGFCWGRGGGGRVHSGSLRRKHRSRHSGVCLAARPPPRNRPAVHLGRTFLGGEQLKGKCQAGCLGPGERTVAAKGREPLGWRDSDTCRAGCSDPIRGVLPPISNSARKCPEVLMRKLGMESGGDCHADPTSRERGLLSDRPSPDHALRWMLKSLFLSLKPSLFQEKKKKCFQQPRSRWVSRARRRQRRGAHRSALRTGDARAAAHPVGALVCPPPPPARHLRDQGTASSHTGLGPSYDHTSRPLCDSFMSHAWSIRHRPNTPPTPWPWPAAS